MESIIATNRRRGWDRSQYEDKGKSIRVYGASIQYWTDTFLLEQILLQHKKCTLNVCVIPEGKTIFPYESYAYTLNNQEYDNLLFHCKRLKIISVKFIHLMLEEKTQGEMMGCIDRVFFFFVQKTILHCNYDR